jgi:hypothetical protein
MNAPEVKPIPEELRALDPANDSPPPGGEGAGSPPPGPPPGVTPGLDSAMRAAAMLVDFLAGAVADRWPAAAYSVEEKTAAAAVLAPVFVKHNITPAWLEKWKEEIAAGFVIGGLAWTGYKRVQAAGAVRAADGARPVEGVIIPDKTAA